jgi:multidrug efflux pump subunit AcrB
LCAILGLVPLGIGLNIDFVGLFTELKPDIFFGGDNANFWGAMAWTIIYGLSFATILTLAVVPMMYLMMYKFKHKVGVKRV